MQNISGMVDAVQDLTRMGAALFLAVGAVTLCVALIGVLCSMLSAAYEKTGEIGIFLALGAQPRDVRRLFLLQSVLLCLTGGVCGMAAAGTLDVYKRQVINGRSPLETECTTDEVILIVDYGKQFGCMFHGGIPPFICLFISRSRAGNNADCTAVRYGL